MKHNFRLTKEQREFVNSQKSENKKKRIIESLRSQYEFENSLEGTAYNLKILPCRQKLERTIVQTVHELPKRVKQFVYDNCEFLSISRFEGLCLDVNARYPWLIMLRDNASKSTIAHEIAHARLGHKTAEPCPPGDSEKNERAAWQLAGKWGFHKKIKQRIN